MRDQNKHQLLHRIPTIWISLIYSICIFNATDPQFPQINTDDPATRLTGIATLGATLLAGYKCLTGDCNVHVRPNLGLNYDPNTGKLSPALTANVQVFIYLFGCWRNKEAKIVFFG